jgi:hypothetical protein
MAIGLRSGAKIWRRGSADLPQAPFIDLTGLPDFYVVGPPRTGTTWLHNVMQNHVNLPRVVKEPRFFDLRYGRGFNWYRAHFQPLVPGQLMGEMAATYFYSAPARTRIAAATPRAKIICTLRDPVQRLHSLYAIRRAVGSVPANFLEAITRDHELVESNRYLHHLRGWIDAFGRDHVLVLTYEQLVRDPQSYVDAVCNFIGIERIPVLESMKSASNSSVVLNSPTLGRLTWIAVRFSIAARTHGFRRTIALIKKLRLRSWFLSDEKVVTPPLDSEVAETLRRRMLPEIEELERLLNFDLSQWKPGRARPIVEMSGPRTLKGALS